MSPLGPQPIAEGGPVSESQLPPSVVSSSLKALGEVTGATKLNFSAGTFQTATLKGATTFQVENAPSRPAILELLVNTGTGFTFSIEGVNWLGSEPTFSAEASKKYLITLLLLEGTVYGIVGLQGKEGAAGTNGSTIRNGTGAPSSELGANGDFYLDTAAQKIYGPKTAGAWGSGTSYKGETGATGETGAEAFNAASKLLVPSTVEVFKEPGASTKEAATVSAAPQLLRTLFGFGEKTLTSGTPLGLIIPVPAKLVIHGIVWAVKTEETTPANRTHLWVALLNATGEVVRRSLDYTSSTNTPMTTTASAGKLRGVKFTESYEVGGSNTVVYAVICEVMSSTSPITLYSLAGGATINGLAPMEAASFPATQTTPTEFKGTPAMTAASAMPYLVLV